MRNGFWDDKAESIDPLLNKNLRLRGGVAANRTESSRNKPELNPLVDPANGWADSDGHQNELAQFRLSSAQFAATLLRGDSDWFLVWELIYSHGLALKGTLRGPTDNYFSLDVRGVAS